MVNFTFIFILYKFLFMKKNTIKAFTLVEMLIVIVIIGILIASLMPRMQSAQWRARDVARKNDLAQIQTAIITSQQDRGAFPGMSSWATSGIPVVTLETDLKTAGMTQVPWDPNGSNEVYWLWSANSDTWQYIYMVTKRNGVDDAWFVLMAKTEVEWWSNWVTCQNVEEGNQKLASNKWYIWTGDDLKDVATCTKFVHDETDTPACGINTGTSTCTYDEVAELRYILVY